MARKKGAKNRTTGRRFKSYEGRFPEDKHLRLTKDMMLDQAYMSLSFSAKTLYSYMKLWACGQDTVTYAASMTKAFMSKKTFHKARDELVNAGFIDYLNPHCAKDFRETGEYQFVNRWQIRPLAVAGHGVNSNKQNDGGGGAGKDIKGQ